MKKLIAILAVLSAFAGVLSAQVPEFPDEKAYIIDSSKIPGKIRDSVKLRNVSSFSDFVVTISAYDEQSKKWVEFGKGRLKGLGDTETVNSVDRKNIKLANYNYFAISNDSNGEFKYSASKGSNDLHIWFYDAKNIDESHCQVFDVKMLGGFRDKVKLVGGVTLKSAASFKIYGYNDENETKKAGTVAILKGYADTDSYDTASNGVSFSNFKYIKVVSREEKDFKYSAKCERNDLIITIDEY
ncbi:hypothetical protein [Treponema sp.]|uniref:hypothetical protein n=1 Tax=Treponema sp. TaxID=166 RepID=UPI00388D0F39